jgi:hypothetical protein
MSILGLLFQLAKRVGLVQIGHHIISSNVTWSPHDIAKDCSFGIKLQ